MRPASFLLLGVLTLAVRGQVVTTRPLQGYQVGSEGFDIIMPLSIAQCEPVLIYYNNTQTVADFLSFETPDALYNIISFSIPPGAGYLDWFCNIPTGLTFIASTASHSQTYTVQPGPSFACLGDTTSYSYVDYLTANFQPFTQNAFSASYTSSQL